MTEDPIFLDTSVFVRFFIEGDIELENFKDLKLFTSTSVIEEVSYILLKVKIGEKYNITKHYELLNFLRENPKIVSSEFSEIREDIKTLLTGLSVKVLPSASYTEMWSMVEKYGLLSNDALIVATCKYYGIRKIATFDEDFKRVEFLKLVKMKYNE